MTHAQIVMIKTYVDSDKKSTHLEQDGIVLEELWEIGVPECTQKYHVFILVGVLSFE